MKPDKQNRSRGKPLVSSETRRHGFYIEPIGPISTKEMKLPIVKWGMKCQARAFTLIELLVVIAIIGILAAMIMAALSKAKNSASNVTDINNLRQIMIALQTFTADNEDVLPMPNWDNGAAGSPKGWLYEVDSSASGPDSFKANTGLLWRALQNPKIYFCPMDTKPDETRYSESRGTDMERRQQISSYAMNGAVIGYGVLDTPVKLSAMHPTDCAFWETDERDPWYFNDGANWPGEGVSPRHNQGAIQAAFDTSVDYVDLRDWYKDVDEPGKNRLWCYPNSEDGGGPNGHNP
jgi:prepilin-type N-terminal cleavage/methylation domain-containing protein